MTTPSTVEDALTGLLCLFNENWEQHEPRLVIDLTQELSVLVGSHSLGGEIGELAGGRGGSLPFFREREVLWCTLAPDISSLTKKVAELRTWVMGSYGWEGRDDGFRESMPVGTPLQTAIAEVSSQGYFRWRTTRRSYPKIEQRFATRHHLEQSRPERRRVSRPSLYELRARFQLALVLGDRLLGDQIIAQIDLDGLDSALNTRLMQLRLWHHFRDFETIRAASWAPGLLDQPTLPPLITSCLIDALGAEDTESVPPPAEVVSAVPEQLEAPSWQQWFDLLLAEEVTSAREILEAIGPVQGELTAAEISVFSAACDELYVNDGLQELHRPLIQEGLCAFLGDFVREPEYPRGSRVSLYLSLFRLWGKVNGGIGAGREEGHVLLEFAHGLLKLNHQVEEVREVVEEWWKARPVVSQVPFALDAIELLTLHHPDLDAPANLWLEAAELLRRNPDALIASEKGLWRSVGLRLGIDTISIDEYLPPERPEDIRDPLSDYGLTSVAIVSTRERQAQSAKEMIEKRCNANVDLVTATKAGNQTEAAVSAQVVLFVWMATTHAVFRAFDGFDRTRISYVQGTGAASIVRALERWVLENEQQL